MSDQEIQAYERHSGNKKHTSNVNTDSVETIFTHVNNIKILIKPYEK